MLFALLSVALVGCSACTLLLFGDTISHNVALRAHERAFDAITHPEGTARVARKTRIGILAGNGNHCDYFIGELRSYSGDKDAVAATYQGQHPAGEFAWLAVVFVDGGEIPQDAQRGLPPDLGELRDWSRRLEESREDYYIVYLLDVGNKAGLDWRCH